MIEVRTRPVGPWKENAYVLVCPDTKDSVLIDPGAEPDTLTELLEGTNPVAILITHTHSDHVGALSDMRDRLKVPVMVNPRPHSNNFEVNEDRSLNDGDTIQVGSHTIRAWETPGHIDDMLCYLVEGEPVAIVGDTIFDGGPGATRSNEAFKETLGTMRNIILTWPDDIICYPGHGPSFRLGDRRAAIEAFLAKDHGDFKGDATWDM